MLLFGEVDWQGDSAEREVLLPAVRLMANATFGYGGHGGYSPEDLHRKLYATVRCFSGVDNVPVKMVSFSELSSRVYLV